MIKMVILDEKRLEETFSIRKTDHPSSVYAVVLSELQQQEVMNDFIKFYGPKIKALNSDVVATYFCKFYGWVLSGFQYMLSLNCSFNPCLSNIELQVFYNQEYDYYGLTFKLKESSIVSCAPEAHKILMEKIYSENVTPLIHEFAANTNVRMKEMWGQLAIGVHYGHDQNMKLAESEGQRKRLDEDFTFLINELDPKYFKENKNPLTIKFHMIESALEPGAYQRMKPTCCLFYQTEGAEAKCYSCPRMSEKEREKRKQEIREKINN